MIGQSSCIEGCLNISTLILKCKNSMSLLSAVITELLYFTLLWVPGQRHSGISEVSKNQISLSVLGLTTISFVQTFFFVASSGQTRLTKVELGALGGLLIGYNLPTKPLHTMKIKPNPSFKCLVEQETDIHYIFAFVHCRYICQLDVKIQGHLIKLQLKKGK